MINTYIKKRNHKREKHLSKLRELTRKLEPISKFKRDKIGTQMMSKVKAKNRNGRQPYRQGIHYKYYEDS